MPQRTEIIAFHLIDNLTGSPRVLSDGLRCLMKTYNVRLFLGSGSGFLVQLPVEICRYWQPMTSSRFLNHFLFVFSQLFLCLSLMRNRSISKEAIIYVNTLLPFGAAIYGKLTSRRVVYHLHENSLEPKIAFSLLFWIFSRCASQGVLVSESMRRQLPSTKVALHVIRNAVPAEFEVTASGAIYRPRIDGFFWITMISSATRLKGIPEFLSLCQAFRGIGDIKFRLVLGTIPQDEMSTLLQEHRLPNLTVVEECEDVRPILSNTCLLLSLTRPDLRVETFGMTILEAMSYGVPIVAPPVGGPAELVRHGKEGYLIDSRDQKALEEAILKLYHNEVICNSMSMDARARAGTFSGVEFCRRIQTFFSSATS